MVARKGLIFVYFCVFGLWLQIREVRHENLIPFIGACVDHGNLCVLTAYCARGSLEDVLANKDLHLDNMFVSSLVLDILKVN
jgi:guanylate cyclase